MWVGRSQPPVLPTPFYIKISLMYTLITNAAKGGGKTGGHTLFCCNEIKFLRKYYFTHYGARRLGGPPSTNRLYYIRESEKKREENSHKR